MHKRVVSVLFLAVSCLAMTACASPAAPAPTLTVEAAPAPTVTVTATPAPRAADTPITATNAWLLCSGATFGQYHDDFAVMPFDDSDMFGKDAMKANDDGTFEVHVMYAPKDGKGYGAMNICVAGGTVGEPTIELHGGVDAG